MAVSSINHFYFQKIDHVLLCNRITYEVEDPVLKEFCQKSCAQDFSECCKNKMNRRKEKLEKKKESENAKSKKSENANLAKLPPTIQVCNS